MEGGRSPFVMLPVPPDPGIPPTPQIQLAHPMPPLRFLPPASLVEMPFAYALHMPIIHGNHPRPTKDIIVNRGRRGRAPTSLFPIRVFSEPCDRLLYVGSFMDGSLLLEKPSETTNDV
ncbi:hypothetical protein KIN20_028293 [Parelaphostrongylus tenuis]|uniref:Uncharacterized protein n=1 Tax=Parelaphostrongylus tenuis TaxID=148309 RepID=A0AAD5R0X6_PARTN|nr:hypothetical protein KIN20_028293 [Parelaphostrongylus tenuis]